MTKTDLISNVVRGCTSFALNDSVFEPLPSDDPRVIRRREVVQFRSEIRPNEKPRWNASVLDENHKFPERPNMHSLKRYGGVDITNEVFPSCIRGTSYLRSPARVPPWMKKSAEATTNSQRIFSLDPPSRPHYLVSVITEGFSKTKEDRRRRWNSSTFCGDSPRRIGDAKEAQISYVELNKKKNGLLNEDAYTSPIDTVTAMNERIRELKRRLRQKEEEESRLQVDFGNIPAVFKMSNIDDWWHLDPVLLAGKAKDAVATDVNRN